MKALLSLAVVAAVLLTGCGGSVEATTSHTKPFKTQTAAPLVDEGTPDSIEEDEPGWDCWTMGTKTCGANPIQRTEAWGAFQTSSVPQDLLKEAFRATYYGIANEGVDFPPSQYVTIPSQITVGKVHVFLIERIPA